MVLLDIQGLKCIPLITGNPNCRKPLLTEYGTETIVIFSKIVMRFDEKNNRKSNDKIKPILIKTAGLEKTNYDWSAVH